MHLLRMPLVDHLHFRLDSPVLGGIYKSKSRDSSEGRKCGLTHVCGILVCPFDFPELYQQRHASGRRTYLSLPRKNVLETLFKVKEMKAKSLHHLRAFQSQSHLRNSTNPARSSGDREVREKSTDTTDTSSSSIAERTERLSEDFSGNNLLERRVLHLQQQSPNRDLHTGAETPGNVSETPRQDLHAQKRSMVTEAHLRASEVQKVELEAAQQEFAAASQQMQETLHDMFMAMLTPHSESLETTCTLPTTCISTNPSKDQIRETTACPIKSDTEVNGSKGAGFLEKPSYDEATRRPANGPQGLDEVNMCSCGSVSWVQNR